MAIDIKKFPFDKARPKQKSILRTIDKTDKKYIIIEAETGIGKSAVATTVCRSYDNGFIITSTKQLLDQYKNDFVVDNGVIVEEGLINSDDIPYNSDYFKKDNYLYTQYSSNSTNIFASEIFVIWNDTNFECAN